MMTRNVSHSEMVTHNTGFEPVRLENATTALDLRKDEANGTGFISDQITKRISDYNEDVELIKDEN